MKPWLAALLLLLAACTGPVGEQGPMGPPGEQGRPGVAGYGVSGPDGPLGEQGPIGEPGPRGDRGLPGEQGPRGEQGPQGERGLVGRVGPQGEPGPRGQTGPAGPIGVEGLAVGRWLVHFTGLTEVGICEDNDNDYGPGVSPYRIYLPRRPLGDVWCVAFTAPYPIGTSREFFEAGLNTGYAFQDREALDNELWHSGPLAEAREPGGGTERRPWRDHLLLLNADNRVGVMFEDEHLTLVVESRMREHPNGLNIDDWTVFLTRLGPPVVAP